ncbi:MAG: hypothetical protein KC441_13375 [Anaerolineales bacterium]|nr:hypothetical protein [Anaerolineales bacterium]
MNRYQNLYQKFLGIAFIVGPLLFVLAALVFTLITMQLGFELEAQEQLYIEGIIMSYAVILFIPIYLELARLLGQRYPRYGLICAVLGLFGMATAVLAATARIWQLTFLRAGVNESVWDLIETTPEMMPIALLAPFGPLTTLLLGIGLLRVPTFPRWSALLLIVGGISFVLAQAAGIAIAFFYPLATIAWFVALAPLGWRIWAGRVGDMVMEETAVA